MLPALFLIAAADIGDIVKVVFIVIFVLGGLLKTLFNNIQQAKQRGNLPLGGPPARPPVEPVRQRTVEEYRERANRKKQLKRPPQREWTPVEVVEAEIAEPETVSQHVARHLNTSGTGARSLSRDRAAATHDREREEQLQKKFDHKVGRLGQSASPESQPISAAIEPEASPLSAAGIAAAAVSVPTAAAEVLELMRSPQGLRQAFVFSEVFSRPEKNW